MWLFIAMVLTEKGQGELLRLKRNVAANHSCLFAHQTPEQRGRVKNHGPFFNLA
jgi:hypothetical protein